MEENGQNSFSFSFEPKDVNPTELQAKIYSGIQQILEKRFSEQEKRRISEKSGRLNFACPYCGDSHRNAHAKRGNFYYNRLIFICFNCDKKTTFDRFCKDFNEQLDPDKKLEMIEHLNSVMTYSDYEGDFVDARFENLIDMSELERVFSQDITPISDFKPIQVNGGVYKYLVGRGIPPEYHKNIYLLYFKILINNSLVIYFFKTP
jgi:hypothetical protein